MNAHAETMLPKPLEVQYRGDAMPHYVTATLCDYANGDTNVAFAAQLATPET